MLRVAVVGATGYTGEQIVDIICKHPNAEITFLSSRVEQPKPYWEQFPRFRGRLDVNLEALDADKIDEVADVVFLSLPHTVSFQYAPLFLGKGKTVIDLSADYRLKDYKTYEKFYNVEHTDVDHLKDSVYGLPEIYRDEIKNSKFIANPGCYPTVSALSVMPVVKAGLNDGKVIIDAKSGITGAGRKGKLEYHYAELNENYFAYKLFKHQHVPEMTQTLENVSAKNVDILFTPQVFGFERGIYVTAYITLNKEMTKDEIMTLYKEAYADEPFVRLYENGMPQLRSVRQTNFCDIGFEVEGKQLVVCACIDNLMKGAASQAVQNMNIIHGFEETAGLI